MKKSKQGKKLIQELALDNERVLNFFQTGPVQKAALEDYVKKIIIESAKAISKAENDDRDFRCNHTILLQHFGLEY